MLMSIENLSVSYYLEKREIKAVRDASFDVKNGEIVGLIGESGSGKTTLAKAIVRAIKPPGRIVSGKIIFKDKDILKMDYNEFRREILWKEISYVPQASMNSLNGVMRIIEHFYDTAMSHGFNDEEEIEKRAEELVKMVKLDPRVLRMYPHELSGGMKQRVIIALSLLLNPSLVIMDEPVSALDVVTQKHILDLIKRLNKELGITVLFITHDIALVKYIADKIAVMYGGYIMEIGRTEEVMTNPYNPYTMLLIRAIPSLRGDLSTLKPIKEGEIPDTGCPFSTRCEFVTEACKTWNPEAYEVNSRIVRCIRYADKVRKG